LAKGNAFSYSPSQVRDIASRLGLILKKDGDSGESGEGGVSQETLGETLGAPKTSAYPPESSTISTKSTDSITDGICEYCGKLGALSRTADGEYICGKCLREASEP
jgi:hypothetical protein